LPGWIGWRGTRAHSLERLRPARTHADPREREVAAFALELLRDSSRRWPGLGRLHPGTAASRELAPWGRTGRPRPHSRAAEYARQTTPVVTFGLFQLPGRPHPAGPDRRRGQGRDPARTVRCSRRAHRRPAGPIAPHLLGFRRLHGRPLRLLGAARLHPRRLAGARALDQGAMARRWRGAASRVCLGDAASETRLVSGLRHDALRRGGPRARRRARCGKPPCLRGRDFRLGDGLPRSPASGRWTPFRSALLVGRRPDVDREPDGGGVRIPRLHRERRWLRASEDRAP
jgi:hypothetical protein